jgi:hypothetical protein
MASRAGTRCALLFPPRPIDFLEARKENKQTIVKWLEGVCAIYEGSSMSISQLSASHSDVRS